MKFIIFNQQQSEAIRGKYGVYSGLDPIRVFRNKYLSGMKVPFTRVEEFALPLEVFESEDLKQIRGFLKCFPVYDADYFIETEDIETGKLEVQFLNK